MKQNTIQINRNDITKMVYECVNRVLKEQDDTDFGYGAMSDEDWEEYHQNRNDEKYDAWYEEGPFEPNWAWDDDERWEREHYMSDEELQDWYDDNELEYDPNAPKKEWKFTEPEKSNDGDCDALAALKKQLEDEIENKKHGK